MLENAPIIIQDQQSTAVVGRHGAQVLSWKHAGGERLFISPLAKFANGHPVRGGVPVIFPQFSSRGPGPRHGFARILPWELIHDPGEDGNAVEFRLRDTPESVVAWPHAFEARLRAEVGPDRLVVSLTIRNTGREPFSATVALHTYLSVDDVSNCWIEGLQRIAYQDATRGDSWHVQDEQSLHFSCEVDRVYRDSPGPLVLAGHGTKLQVQQQGFRDTVVWNPGAELATSIVDLGPGGHRGFVCIEAASIHHPVEVGPGAEWNGSQTLIV